MHSIGQTMTYNVLLNPTVSIPDNNCFTAFFRENPDEPISENN